MVDTTHIQNRARILAAKDAPVMDALVAVLCTTMIQTLYWCMIHGTHAISMSRKLQIISEINLQIDRPYHASPALWQWEAALSTRVIETSA